MNDALPKADEEETAAHDRRAPFMFFVALAYLVVLAAVIPHGAASDGVSAVLLSSGTILFVFFGLWAFIVMEGIAGWLAAEDGAVPASKRLALVCAVPAFRMSLSPARPNDAVWLPGLGWIAVCRTAVMEMERRLVTPMIAVTVLIVPIIAADFLLLNRPHEQMEGTLAEVVDTAVSRKGQRLFLIDDRDRTVATLLRPEGHGGSGIEGAWTVPGESDPPTRLVFSADAAGVSLETGCAVVAGTFGDAGIADLRRTGTCAPTPLEIGLYVITSFIWFAFAAEFVLLVSLAEKKADFCKRHWINIVIILLPLLAFLRSFQAFRFLKFVKSGKIMRAYRLRGIFTRLGHLAITLNLVDRVRARNSDKFTSHLDRQIAEKEIELEELRAKLEAARVP